MMLTTHLHLMPRSRMSRSYPPLLFSAYMVSSGTALLFLCATTINSFLRSIQTDNQEVQCLSWKLKSHYSVPKSPMLDPVLRQLNPFHTFTFCFFKIHFNIVYHLHLGLPNGLFLSGFPTKILYTCQISPMHITCTIHLILLDLITSVIFGEE
jgi:hypothetical protein